MGVPKAGGTGGMVMDGHVADPMGIIQLSMLVAAAVERGTTSAVRSYILSVY